MNRSLRTIFNFTVLLMLGCSSGGIHSHDSKYGEVREKKRSPLAGTFQVHRFVLGNGLRLLVVEDHSSPTFAYQTWFRVGSSDEIPGYTGLAHLFEHMMFKQTTHMKEGEFDRLLEGAGAEGENAFTSRDYTGYIQELPKGNLELIARAEADRMVNLVISDSAFRTEREVVQNERRFRNENSPDGLMDQELFELAFRKHPYHWPIIGYQQDLDRMESRNALDFYKAHYGPDRATIVVSGDVEPDQVVEVIQKYYGDLPPTSGVKYAEAPAAEPEQTAPRRKTLKLNIQVEKLLMGYRIPNFTDRDMPAVEVLRGLLTGGKSSRLYRALVMTGIATGVDSYDFENKDPSLLVILTNLQKGKRASQAEAVILKELDRIAKQPVQADELIRSKNKIRFEFYQRLDSNFEKCYFLGHYETVAGHFQAGVDHYQKIKDVTAGDVLRVAKKFLSPTRRTVITGVRK